MSIRRNTVANYIGQSYVIALAVIVLPLYLQHLGAESFGLVGFFALLQAWFALLDLGLSPTLGRQVAYARGTEHGFASFRLLLRSIELILLVLGLAVAASIYVTREWFASNWVNASQLHPDVVSHVVTLIGVMIALRGLVGLYRSGIIGMEDQVWLNVANAFIQSTRYIGSLLFLIYFSKEIVHFFWYQIFVAILELRIFQARFYELLPAKQFDQRIKVFDWHEIRKILPFSFSIAYTAGLWVIITQTDKLILSSVLPLAEFGYFTLVATVSGGVLMVSMPITQAMQPRLTRLIAEGRKEEALSLYSTVSQFVTVIAFSLALTVGLYAEPVLYAWTGDRAAASWGSRVLLWFALGNAILSIGAFQYYLQTAFGQLRLHVIGSTISAAIQIPVIYFAAINYGALGAGIAWFCLRIVLFLVWTPIIHTKLIPGFNSTWLLKDIFPKIMMLCVVAAAGYRVVPIFIEPSRIFILFKIISLALFTLFLGFLSLKGFREMFRLGR